MFLKYISSSVVTVTDFLLEPKHLQASNTHLYSCSAYCRLWLTAHALESNASRWASSSCIWRSLSLSFHMVQRAAVYARHGRRLRLTNNGLKQLGLRRLLLVNRSAFFITVSTLHRTSPWSDTSLTSQLVSPKNVEANWWFP